MATQLQVSHRWIFRSTQRGAFTNSSLETHQDIAPDLPWNIMEPYQCGTSFSIILWRTPWPNFVRYSTHPKLLEPTEWKLYHPTRESNSLGKKKTRIWFGCEIMESSWPMARHGIMGQHAFRHSAWSLRNSAAQKLSSTELHELQVRTHQTFPRLLRVQLVKLEISMSSNGLPWMLYRCHPVIWHVLVSVQVTVMSKLQL